MDKQQFIEQLIYQIRSMDINKIIEKYVILRRKGTSYFGLCPFHNDKHLGSFVVTSGKNVYKCFSCEAGGDGINFVAEYEGVKYVEAAYKIGQEHGLITPAKYDEYFIKKINSKSQYMPKIKSMYTAKIKEDIKNNIDTDENLDKTFMLLLGNMTLNKEHLIYLKEERKMDESIINNRMYKSFPPTNEQFNEFMDSLYKRDGSYDALIKMPGFFKKINKNDNTEEWTYTKSKGVVIPIVNADGKCVGLQIRRNERDENKGRYIWFSSSFASYSDDKSNNGTSSGAPIDVIYPEMLKSNTLFITEGRFKSEAILKHYNSVSISVQGVGNWAGIMKEIKVTIKNTKDKFNIDIANIYIAFDSDLKEKPEVFRQAINMYLSIYEETAEDFNIRFINWEEVYGKGIDDLLKNKNNKKIKSFSKEEMEAIYDQSKEKFMIDNTKKEIEDGQQFIHEAFKDTKKLYLQ